MPSSRGSSQHRNQTQADSLLSESPGKPMNTGVGSLSLLQGIFQMQESNWGFLHCRWNLLPALLSLKKSKSVLSQNCLAKGWKVYWFRNSDPKIMVPVLFLGVLKKNSNTEEV